MVRTIVWQRKASLQFDAIIYYLQNKWGDKVAKNFVLRTYQLLETLKQYPEIGTLEYPDNKIRGFVITSHSTLFYRFDDDNLYLLSFFDNRQHPNKKSPF